VLPPALPDGLKGDSRHAIWGGWPIRQQALHRRCEIRRAGYSMVWRRHGGRASARRRPQEKV